MKGLHLALSMLLGFSANAIAAGDPAAGEKKSVMCQGCHGQDGNSFSPEWPARPDSFPAKRKSVREGKRGSNRVRDGGRRRVTKKKTNKE